MSPGAAPSPRATAVGYKDDGGGDAWIAGKGHRSRTRQRSSGECCCRDNRIHYPHDICP